MPFYSDDEEELKRIRRTSTCAECGRMLYIYLDRDTKKQYVACPTPGHEGIAREYQPQSTDYQSNIRREIEMEKEHGLEASKALATIPKQGQLTQPQAMHILKLVYPEAPEDEIVRCAILCRDIGLHPLMKEVYIIGYKKWNKEHTKVVGETWSTVIGIAANRKLAANRKGAYSFMDDSPRAATEEEIVKQYGENSEEERDNLISICRGKGEKGNTAIGFGLWPKDKEPKGTEKGNTKRNMANIRSERNFLDRLPGEPLPSRDIEVIDEAYAEVPDMGKVELATGEIKERAIEGEFEELPEEPPETKPSEIKEGLIDLGWLKESVTALQVAGQQAYSDESLSSYMKMIYKVEGTDIYEIASTLDKGKATHFVKVIQDALDKL